MPEYFYLEENHNFILNRELSAFSVYYFFTNEFISNSVEPDDNNFVTVTQQAEPERKSRTSQSGVRFVFYPRL